MNHIARFVVSLAIVLISCCCALSGYAKPVPRPPLVPVTSVDLAAYAGHWYEVALIPYSLQKNCLKNGQVDYTALSAGVFRDHFDCETAKGSKLVFEGRAKVVDKQSNAIWSATFLNLLGWRYWFGNNYYIVDRAPDYGYAVVVHPTRNYAWVLAKTPSLPVATFKQIQANLLLQGVDACRLKLSPQSKGEQQPISLCDLTKGF